MRLNDERKALEAAILDAATAQAERALAENPQRGVIIAAGEGWHPGVIGIVAGRLKDRFHLPSIVIGWGDGLGPVAKGSGRSVKGVNLGAAISEAARQGVILSGGGHAMAGGLSLDPRRSSPPSMPGCSITWTPSPPSATPRSTWTSTPSLAPGAATPALVTAIASHRPLRRRRAGAGVHAAGRQCHRRAPRRHPAPALHGRRRLRPSGIDLPGAPKARPSATRSGRADGFSLVGRLKTDNWNGRDRVQLETLDVTRL